MVNKFCANLRCKSQYCLVTEERLCSIISEFKHFTVLNS